MEPPYTEQQKLDFQSEFKQRRTRQIMVAVPLVILILMRVWLRAATDAPPAWLTEGWLLGVVLAGVGAALVFSFRNWRCPACDRYLGRGINPRFCPRCGVQLGS